MTPRLVPLVLLLIGVTVCLNQETPGANIGSRNVLSEPINNLVEDAIQFNLVKREVISEGKKKEIKKKKRKTGIRKRNKKRENQNGSKERKQIFQKKAGKYRRAKGNGRTEKGSKKGIKNDEKKWSKQRKRSRNRKKTLMKNKKSYQKGKKMKKKEKRKDNKRMGKKYKQNIPWLGCGSVDDAASTISLGIYEFRKFFNHYKRINRTNSYLSTIEKKAQPSKLQKFEEAAAFLKSVTKNGMECPGDPPLAKNVTEIVSNLTKCGNADNSNIVHQCNTNKIKDFLKILIEQEFCAGEYAEWIPQFTKCFNPVGGSPQGVSPKTCKCYDNMIAVFIREDCAKPNVDGNDWIINFNKDTMAVLKKCKGEEKTCKNYISDAFKLATTCCLPKSTSSGSTGKSKRRRIIFENRLQNKLFMN